MRRNKPMGLYGVMTATSLREVYASGGAWWSWVALGCIVAMVGYEIATD